MTSNVFKNQKGVSLTVVVGLILLISLAASAMNLMIIRSLKSSQKIEAANRSYFAAEAGLEDALYELSAHTVGYETPDLSNASVRKTAFNTSGPSWDTKWEIKNLSSNSGAGHMNGTISTGEKLIINFYKENIVTPDPADVIVVPITTSFSAAFSVPSSTLNDAKNLNAFAANFLVFDNDNDMGLPRPIQINRGVNEDSKYDPKTTCSGTGIQGSDNDCDGAENEDSPEDPVITWRVIDGKGNTLAPKPGCLNESEAGKPIGTELCEKSFRKIESFSALLNQDTLGVKNNDPNTALSIKDFVASAGAGSKPQIEFTVVAPLEQYDAITFNKIPIPHLNYQIDYQAAEALPLPYFTIKSDGYYQDFKQSLITKVIPQAVTPLLDFTIILPSSQTARPTTGTIIAGGGSGSGGTSGSGGSGGTGGTGGTGGSGSGGTGSGGTGAICGNSIAETGEQCDDGNTTNGDGCSSSCSIEAPPSPPSQTCGNNITEGSEQCDDGNTANGDGCSTSCQWESFHATNDSTYTSTDLPVDINVLVNDSGFSGFSSSFPITTALGGNVNLSGNLLRYTPPANQENVNDNFTYSITNGSSNSTANVNITIYRAKTVFISYFSGRLQGLLGFSPGPWGIQGADNRCQYLADSVGIGSTQGKSFKAWVSNDTDENTWPINRFSVTEFNAGFRLLNGNYIAKDWADLIDGSLLNPINIDQRGITATTGHNTVWTGTDEFGRSNNPNGEMPSCNGWTTQSGNGSTGHAAFTDHKWTRRTDSQGENITTACNNFAHQIYCFED